MENICTKAKNCKKLWTTKWRRKGSLWKLRDLGFRSGLWCSHPAQVVEATPCAAAPRNLFEKSSRWLLKIRQRICHENPTKHFWLLAQPGGAHDGVSWQNFDPWSCFSLCLLEMCMYKCSDWRCICICTWLVFVFEVTLVRVYHTPLGCSSGSDVTRGPPPPRKPRTSRSTLHS